MTVRPAVPGDLPRIFEIYAAAREYMKKTGNPTQWGDLKPLREDVEADVIQGRSRVVCDDDGTVRGVFALFTGADPTYASIEEGAWPNGEEYLTIHRIAGDG
ncbi:MAG: N-acetyltransferase, partial [Clostridia bacterium]|nr:N-acetyltransferase [Clostridia bacterium]